MRAGKVDEQEYRRLVASVLPHVIHSEKENERYTAILEELLRKRKRTAEEHRLAELLTLLIEDFEEKRYSLAAVSPIELLRHLMDANGLRQADLLDVFGTASIASEVLRGKRELAKSHIEKLSRRFNISAGLFFEPRQHVA
jgi:HTH-type transcriptional regulator/antitoxin HigA